MDAPARQNISPLALIGKATGLARDITFRFSKCYGVDLRRLRLALGNTPRFVRDYKTYMSRLRAASPASRQSFSPRKRFLYPCLGDYDDTPGALGVYFHQDLWAARKVYARRPERHVDIGSRIDGFIAHLLVFMNVSVVDVREMKSPVPGLDFVRADATTMVLFENDSVDSLSSLHAAEHFGLGRYGDPVDPDACFDFMRNLQRVLAVGGRLLFSVPIGEERVFFNAHRVFSPITVLKTFHELSLVSFSAVTRENESIEDAAPEAWLEKRYKVGLFEFTKETPQPVSGGC